MLIVEKLNPRQCSTHGYTGNGTRITWAEIAVSHKTEEREHRSSRIIALPVCFEELSQSVESSRGLGSPRAFELAFSPTEEQAQDESPQAHEKYTALGVVGSLWRAGVPRAVPQHPEDDG